MERTYNTGFRLGSFRRSQATSLEKLLSLAVSLFVFGFVSLSGQVQVEIQNLAAVSPGAIRQASQTAERTFSVSGIPTSWRVMQDAAHPTEAAPRLVRLRLVSSRHAFSANPHAMGEALVTEGGGSLAIVYVDRVRAFAQKHRLPFATALAYAAAHEVGHLLRGDNQHTDSGLMRACWDRRDAEAMRSAKLAPDAESASEMAANLAPDPGKTIALENAPPPVEPATATP
jgi:hypothetical protein